MKPFRAYRNLHKGNFSIQSYIKDKSGYRVIDRLDSVIFEDCNLKVYETGRQKVIKEKRKGVHAYVESNFYEVVGGDVNTASLREIYYNPYDFDSFVYKDTLIKVYKVNRVLAYDNKLYDVSNMLI